MKKVSFKFSSLANTIEEFYTSKLDKLTEDEFVSVFNTMRTAVNNGDVWLRSYFIEDGKANLVWFLDSDTSIINVQSAIDILVTIDDYIEHTIDSSTFEEFAAYAASNEDTDISHPRIEAITELNN
jgi:uncharacterized SAM-dependent methyltransferase